MFQDVKENMPITNKDFKNTGRETDIANGNQMEILELKKYGI
jgi:hypothetical protein